MSGDEPLISFIDVYILNQLGSFSCEPAKLNSRSGLSIFEWPLRSSSCDNFLRVLLNVLS